MPEHALASVPWEALGERLREGGLDEAILARGERILPARHDALRLPLVHHALRLEGSAASVLARLFVYDDAVARASLGPVLGDTLCEALVRAGVLVDAAEGVTSRLRITPFQGLLVVSDPTHGDDPVIPPGPTTLELARCVGEVEGASVLDLGCGPGTLAALAARRGAASVTATDVSARALALAEATARLGGVAYERLLGDLDAPVAGRRFDRVLCQPPFVPRPRTHARTTYLHGGARGDELAVRVLAALPSLLAPGGIALLRVDLPGAPEEVAAWLTQQLPCEALAFLARGPRADELAVAYATAHQASLGPALAPAITAYAEHFAHEAIAEVTAVLLVAWPAPRPRVFARPVPSLAQVDAGTVAHARHALALAAAPPDALLALAMRPRTGARLVSTTDLESHRTSLVVEARGELPRAISEPVALLLDVLAQGATLGEAAESLARATGAPLADTEASAVQFAREALASGLLVAT
jgi:SAM-dependent methyltransferase